MGALYVASSTVPNLFTHIAKKLAMRRFCISRSCLHHSAAVVLILSCVALLQSNVMAQEFRTWTDATGKFKVKAKFVELSDDKVTLEREDGSELAIPLKKLSSADRKVVAQMQTNAENPFETVQPAHKPGRKKPKEDDVAEEGASEGGEMEEDDSSEQAEEQIKIVRPRWERVKQVLPIPARSEWNVTVTPPAEAAARKGRVIGLQATRDVFEKLTALELNANGQRAVIGYLLDRPGMQRDVQIRLVLCDLEKGTRLTTIKKPGNMVPMALNDAGDEIVMCRNEFGFGNNDRLELWRVTRSGVTKTLQWIPNDDLQHGDRDIQWAAYIDAERLATAGGGRLAIWKAATAKPLYWLKIQNGCRPALTTDRKYLAFATDKEIGILDLAAGKVVAITRGPKEHLSSPTFAFTPKGTRLACGCQDRIYVFDVATGGLYREIPLAGTNAHANGHLLCPSEEHLLLGNSLLVDVESQAKLWTYQGHQTAAVVDGLCWLAITGHGQDAGALLPVRLPHPRVAETIRKAIESPDFFILKPGTTVKLDVANLPDPGEREKAATAFADKLRANGCQVGADGTVELTLATEMGKRREVAYQAFGSPVARPYMFQEYTSRVKVVYQGQTAWEVSCNNVPGFIELKQGETMEGYLKQKEHPNYAWFSTVELPRMVQKPTTNGGTLGTTQVTVSGLR